MPTTLLPGAIFALILSQTTIDKTDCQAHWLDVSSFDTIASVELAEVAASQKSHSVTAKVICRKQQVTVVVGSRSAPNVHPPLKRSISLYDTPEDMRTRTLALAVSDAVKDFFDALSSRLSAKNKPAVTTPQDETAQPVAVTPSGNAASGNVLHRFHTQRHVILDLSILSSITSPHAAPSLRWTMDMARWRFGIQGAGMRFENASGKAYTGEAALHVGYTVFDFISNTENLGELNIGILLGLVHARGNPIAPNSGENHTQPLAALETDFTFYVNPLHRNALGLRIFGGWMLGMTLRVNNEKIGGFNGFYAGAGIVVLLHGN